MRTADELPPDGPAVQAGPSPGTLSPGASVTPPVTDELESQSLLWSRNRRAVVRVLLVIFLVSPFFTRPRPGAVQTGFAAAATAAMLAIVVHVALPIREDGPRRGPRRFLWAWLVVVVGLGSAILALGGSNFVNALVIAGACIGLLAPTARLATIGAAACVAAGLGIDLYHHAHYQDGLTIALGPLLACFFAYAAARRAELVSRLRETRAELARMAVADERLRIARDLHDLLGHSLSLITLKAELAGRMVGTDPDRATREIGDLEAVARRSLGEVRAAVTSYRQPSLAAELAGARRMLAAAGMDCDVHAPESFELPAETEALLAWTVREGATNVVRHSGARRATITISVADDEAVAEVADDGVGPALDSARGPGELGAGLAGLAERARAVGAEVSAGEGRGGKGFRLRVRVPAGQFSVS
jgi:two-component system, NarL family, sensor histidine kinase DesK